MLVEGGGGLKGYAILRSEVKWGLTMVFVMELVTQADDEDAFDRLISGITAHALTMGADAVSIVATPAWTWTDRLLSRGFLKAPDMLLPRRIRLTMKPLVSSILPGELLDQGRWMLSWGDTFYV